MTMKTTNGRSISAVFHAEQKRLKWIAKIHGNCRKLLNRLGPIAEIDTATLRKAGTIVLRYSGLSEDLARIEKVLNVRFVDGKADVKFSRITVQVKLLLKNKAEVKAAA